MGEIKTSDVSAGTRVEQVAAALRADIVSGRTPPGNRLPSTRSWRAFVEGRASGRARSAGGLSERRLVEIRHGDGTFARRPQIEDIANSLALLLHLSAEDQVSLVLSLMEVREAIEPAASRMAAERATAADLTELARVMETGIEAAEAGITHAAVEHDLLFHAAVAGPATIRCSRC